MALKILSPWQVWYADVKAMFQEDKEIRVVFDNDTLELTLYVENADKADALGQLLPTEKHFGNQVVKVAVVPANAPKTTLKVSRGNLYERAFANNPALDSVVVISGIMVNDLTYVIFKKTVVQYYIDDLGDPHGNKTTLYQDIAKNIFEATEGVFFCTANEANFSGLTVPSGGWVTQPYITYCNSSN